MEEQEQEQITQRFYTYGGALAIMATLVAVAFILGGFITPSPYELDDVGYPPAVERTME